MKHNPWRFTAFALLSLMPMLFSNCVCGPVETEDDEDVEQTPEPDPWGERYDECVNNLIYCCGFSDDEFAKLVIDMVCSTLKDGFDIDPNGPCMETAFNEFFACCCDFCSGDEQGFMKECLAPFVDQLTDCVS